MIAEIISKSQVDKAGKKIRESLNKNSTYKKSINVVKKWRSNHSESLRSVRYHIEYEGKKIDNGSLTIQRLKRIISIENKLKRSTVRLSKMQDIGGCRIIVSDINKLIKLKENLSQANPRNKKLINVVDYTLKPNLKTGYRGIHLIYKCSEEYQIEAQLRTKLQHYWATSVEIAGTYLNQNIKAGIVEEKFNDWLEFFRLSSILFAQEEYRKNNSCVVQYEENENEEIIKQKILGINRKINALYKLGSYSFSNAALEENNLIEGDKHFILKVDEEKGRINILSFSKNQEENAKKKYSALERQNLKNSEINIVMVSAKSLREIKTGFPNYFADSRLFIQKLSGIIYK